MTTDFNGKTVSVIGLGISNTPLIEYLLKHGAEITARDKKPFDMLAEKVRSYKEKGVKFICGDNYLDDIKDQVVFKAPGIRYDIPQIANAVANGSELNSEMELFFELCPAKIIGITGSDGKTTTTTLIYKALCSEYGRDKVFVGGNIGAPLFPLVDSMDSTSFAIVELSSFQLQTMTHSPSIAVITNISPNHLDYHTDMNEYIESKKNIFRFQKPHGRLVLNASNDITRAMKKEANESTEVVMFCDPDRIHEENGIIYAGTKPFLRIDDILIPGHHNVENYMAMIAALYDIVSPSTVTELARTFGGVEHRCELVRELDGVKYYNSSIDSSPTRTCAALSSFKQKLIVICGGYDKHIPFEPLAGPLCEKARAVILTGATAGKIKDAIISSPNYSKGNPEIIEIPDFQDAVNTARNISFPGDIVLLSPACASFDAFPNFEARGNTFKKIVNNF